jgi:hypothetical protein
MQKLFVLCAFLAAFVITNPVLANGDPPPVGGDIEITDNTVTDNFSPSSTSSVDGTISPTFTGTQTGTVSPTITGTQTGTVSPTFENIGANDSGNSESSSSADNSFQIGHSGGGYDGEYCEGDCGDGVPSGDILSPKQQQGQIGVNRQFGINDQGQGQGQFGYVDSHDLYEAQERDPVSSAAPVSASACASGVSAQGVDLGGAVAVVNPYCNVALVAEAAAARGMTEVAEEMVNLMADMARADVEGVFGFRKFVRKLPVLGGVLKWVF